MQQWRRIPLALLALWALFFTTVPQTMWACPMTGRVAVSARVCAMPQTRATLENGAMPCAHSCCKPLSLPPAQFEDHAQGAQLFTAALSAPSLVFAPVHSAVAPFIAAPAVSFEAPAVRAYLARFTGAPPPLLSQFTRSAHAGRAPPVI